MCVRTHTLTLKIKLVLWCNSAGRFEGLLSCVWIQKVQIKNAALNVAVDASGLQAGLTDCQSKLQVLQAYELLIKTGVKWSCQLFSGGFEDVLVHMDAASKTHYMLRWGVAPSTPASVSEPGGEWWTTSGNVWILWKMKSFCLHALHTHTHTNHFRH